MQSRGLILLNKANNRVSDFSVINNIMHTKYSKEAINLLEELEFLFKNYSLELRATTQPHYLNKVAVNVPEFAYHPENVLVRETLLEHVGSLPMTAIAFYPHINNSGVDLGKALTMLAIHDIGELITGDEMTFTKNASSKSPEHDAALSLLNPIYHELYEDVESQTSLSAKFAKSIDKINPDIIDYLTPADITLGRFKHFVNIDKPNEIIGLIRAKKHPYMLWNPFMVEFHNLLLDKLADKLIA